MLATAKYNEQGYYHVGFTSAFAKTDKEALTAELEKLIGPPGFTAGQSKSMGDKPLRRMDMPLKTKLVVEVELRFGRTI